MRLCVPVGNFFGGIPFIDGIRRIKELGFDAVETYGWKSLDLDAVRNTCEETGVELISMCTSEFRMTDAAYRQAWLDGLKESCAAANRVGAKRLITQVGQDTGEDRRIQHENIVETLKLARPILEESGVTIMLEPLNTLVDHKGYYLWSAVEGFDIVKEVDCQFVKIVYDIYHQQVSEGNIIPNIVNNLDLIAHLHSAGHPGRHELQFGESDYKVIFSAVDKAGYTGCCGLEYGPLLPPEESLIKAKEIYG